MPERSHDKLIERQISVVSNLNPSIQVVQRFLTKAHTLFGYSLITFARVPFFDSLQSSGQMVDDELPLKFVASWGAFARLMLLGQMQLINQGVNITLPYQIDRDAEPTLMAALDRSHPRQVQRPTA